MDQHVSGFWTVLWHRRARRQRRRVCLDCEAAGPLILRSLQPRVLAHTRTLPTPALRSSGSVLSGGSILCRLQHHLLASPVPRWCSLTLLRRWPLAARVGVGLWGFAQHASPCTLALLRRSRGLFRTPCLVHPCGWRSSLTLWPVWLTPLSALSLVMTALAMLWHFLKQRSPSG